METVVLVMTNGLYIKHIVSVFPTCVGMFLTEVICQGRRRFPHVCGDVSSNKVKQEKNWLFSPRVWGCFLYINLYTGADYVFPTCVGMFPKQKDKVEAKRGFPHVCGDVSYK